MTDATLIRSTQFNDVVQAVSKKFTIPSIIAGGNDTFVFDLVDTNLWELLQISINCSSVDFDFSLHVNSDTTGDNVDEIVLIVDINKSYLATDMNVRFINDESGDLPYLYGKLINTDGVNATGEITIELVLSPM